MFKLLEDQRSIPRGQLPRELLVTSLPEKAAPKDFSGTHTGEASTLGELDNIGNENCIAGLVSVPDMVDKCSLDHRPREASNRSPLGDIKDLQEFFTAELTNECLDKSVIRDLVSRFGDRDNEHCLYSDFRGDGNESIILSPLVHDAIHEVCASESDETLLMATGMTKSQIGGLQLTPTEGAVRLLLSVDPAGLRTELRQARTSSNSGNKLFLRYGVSQLARGFLVLHGIPDFAAKYLGRKISRWVFGPLSTAESNREKWLALVEKLLRAHSLSPI